MKAGDAMANETWREEALALALEIGKAITAKMFQFEATGSTYKEADKLAENAVKLFPHMLASVIAPILCKREPDAREAEMERCCKDVCYACANPEIWGMPELVADSWMHRASTAELECEAAAIRERWDGKREGQGDD